MVSQPVLFDDLVREGLALIPGHAPNWTNYNPSDPGITLIELLAWLSEMLAYRADRISPDARLNLLRLLHGADWTGWRQLTGQPAPDIDAAITRQLHTLSQVQCAITVCDFEHLAARFAAERLGPSHSVQVAITSGSELQTLIGADDPNEAPHRNLGVVLAPEQMLTEEEVVDLCRHVREQLEPLCLLTSQVHVVRPVYVIVDVACHIAVSPGFDSESVLAGVTGALLRRFGPAQKGDPPATHRRLGRPVYLSQIAEVIDDAEGVDYAQDIEVCRLEREGQTKREHHPVVGVRIGTASRVGRDTCPGGSASYAFERFERDPAGEITSVRLHPWELARVRLATGQVNVFRPRQLAVPQPSSAGARQ
jgi:hypothetical protein